MESDSKMNQRIQEWKQMVRVNPMEALWELIEIARFGIMRDVTLYEPPLFYIIKENDGSEMYLFMRRFLSLLYQLTVDDLQDLAALFPTLDVMPIERDTTEAMNLVLRGRENYEKFLEMKEEEKNEYLFQIPDMQTDIKMRRRGETKDAIPDRLIFIVIKTGMRKSVNEVLECYRKEVMDDIVLRHIKL